MACSFINILIVFFLINRSKVSVLFGWNSLESKPKLMTYLKDKPYELNSNFITSVLSLKYFVANK